MRQYLENDRRYAKPREILTKFDLIVVQGHPRSSTSC